MYKITYFDLSPFHLQALVANCRQRMRNFTWNRFPIKHLPVDTLLTPCWKVRTWLQTCASLNHRKAEHSRLIPRKHTENLELLTVIFMQWCWLWSSRIELGETCFLINVSIVISHYNVTLDRSNEHFTPCDSVSAYKKMWAAMQFGNVESHAATMITQG